MKPAGIMAVLVLVFALAGCGKIKGLARLALESDAGESGEAGVGEVRILTSDDYAEFEQQEGRLVVVDFYADWCAPCRKLAPMLEKVAGEYSGRAVVGKLDIKQEKKIAEWRGVSSIPDLRFYINGHPVDRIVGFPTEEELRKKFQRHTADIDGEIDNGKNADPQKAVEPMSKDGLPPGMKRAVREDPPDGR